MVHRIRTWGEAVSPPITPNHHQSPPITTNHQQSPPITTKHHQSPPITTNHHQPPPTTTDHHQSPPITTNHHQSPPITSNHHQSPPITTNHHRIWLLLVGMYSSPVRSTFWRSTNPPKLITLVGCILPQKIHQLAGVFALPHNSDICNPSRTKHTYNVDSTAQM